MARISPTKQGEPPPRDKAAHRTLWWLNVFSDLTWVLLLLFRVPASDHDSGDDRQVLYLIHISDNLCVHCWIISDSHQVRDRTVQILRDFVLGLLFTPFYFLFRNIGVGVSSMMARIGAILAPYIVLLVRKPPKRHSSQKYILVT